MQQRVAAILGLVAALCAAPTVAAPSAYDTAFVAAFEQACVPGRLGYDTSREAAEAAGWVPVAPGSHSELADLMARSEAEAQDPELQATFEYVAYTKDIEGRPHYLVVSTTSAVISDPADPWVQTGCHLYDFDATAPLDPAAVTTLIGQPIAGTQEAEGIVSHIWGPPCPMPMTGDTYLSFVAEGAPMAAEMNLPFSGIALNFSTTQLDPGAPVPDPYC